MCFSFAVFLICRSVLIDLEEISLDTVSFVGTILAVCDSPGVSILVSLSSFLRSALFRTHQFCLPTSVVQLKE